MIKRLQARKEPRKGRGFGFVTVATEALREKAISEMNGQEIEGRAIAVKVAIDSPGKEEEAPSPKANESAKDVTKDESAPNDENTAPAQAS